MRHVLYNTPSGRTAIDLQDLGGALQTTSTSSWDPLDRLILATAPEGNST